ncbi:MAG: serine/threonine-protein kinase, partial [Planctomycetia bacterium]
MASMSLKRSSREDLAAWGQLNATVDRFEADRRCNPGALVADYLPPVEHPQRDEILRELVRVDFEYAGGARRWVDYVAEFPELAAEETPLVGAASDGDGTPTAPTIADLDTPAPVDGPAERLPAVGEEFAGFHLERLLGRGSFSQVYLARQGWLAGRPVVLKISTTPLGEPDRLARLQNTHVVPIYSTHFSGRFEAICMPFFGERTLQSVLQRLRREGVAPTAAAALFAPDPPPDELARRTWVDAVAWLGWQLAEGLAHAHDRGLLHLDLKPANILVADDGRAMLLDFNLARPDRFDADADRRLAAVGGTLPYLGPEQAAALDDPAAPLDGRADLFSLGVVLYEAATGRLPFPVDAPSASSAGDPAPAAGDLLLDRRRRLATPPPQIRRLEPAVSPALAAIIHRLLKHDPAERYPTARQAAEDLR